MIAKVILLLPALVCAKLHVQIDVSSDKRLADAKAFGDQQIIITDKDRSAFHLDDKQIKDAVEVFHRRRPDGVYLRSPTPWDDLYKLYNWDQVRVKLEPISARVLAVDTKPIIITTKRYRNNGSLPGEYGGEIAYEVSNSVSTTVSTGGVATTGQEVSYSFNFAAGSAGGKTSFSFSKNWGESTTKTLTTTLKSSSSIKVNLPPGASYEAVLSANHGTMKVEVEYEASLTGQVACNFATPHKGRHFWAYEIKSLLYFVDRPYSIISKEIIDIGFYADEIVTSNDVK